MTNEFAPADGTQNAELITHDFTSSPTVELPEGAKQIGEVSHFEGSPNFSSVAVLLSAVDSVAPGQFLCVWHGRRGEKGIFTIAQVYDCREVNPNAMPELSAVRSRLGLAKNYASEGLSTRIYRLALCENIEELIVDAGT